MNLFGLTISRKDRTLAPPAESRAGWFPVIREAFAGGWQKNMELDQSTVMTFHAVFACVTLIAADISKLRMRLVEQDEDTKIWTETTNPAYSPVLRRPNSYQHRIQFWESWLLSKLMRGNTYVLKQRDNRGVVVQLYVLDPHRCRPMVADDGQIFYELQADNLTGVSGDTVIVPAREIIHDRMNTLYHPLCGISPLYASALAATQGLKIQQNSVRFFSNNSRPGGILTAQTVTKQQAETWKEQWEQNFSGDNVGRIAVLGGGLKFEQLTMTAVDAQLIDQLKWTAEVICSTFHIPPYKIGIGPMPTYNNIQSLNVEYYSQCLQKLIEDAEECMDEGLGIGVGVGPPPILGTEFDVENLLRMDSVTQMNVLKEAIGASVMAPNEARRVWNLPPVEGGDSPMAQQQDFSLAALAKRDAQADPFGAKPAMPPAALPPPAAAPTKDGDDGRLKQLVAADLLRRSKQPARVA